MIFIVKYFDSDVQEWSELEHGNGDHANETYDMYKGLEGVQMLHMMGYDVESREYSLIR